ncbi:UNKNOWN [Stylonychia lemnae]|uniref:Uncharacterized protein n=1 Tax=Stylonychia lemnae TaxID=5949 RepID=A0A078A8U3_STYLE|nr:UNKNOWN [Stylonychia lemnae]|eukprot:CDW78296.1 UNKNOWN [Stylonychia lemnae]
MSVDKSITAPKIQENQFSQEYIQFQVKQIKKQRAYEQKVVQYQQNPDLLVQQYKEQLIQIMLGPDQSSKRQSLIKKPYQQNDPYNLQQKLIVRRQRKRNDISADNIDQSDSVSQAKSHNNLLTHVASDITLFPENENIQQQQQQSESKFKSKPFKDLKTIQHQRDKTPLLLLKDNSNKSFATSNSRAVIFKQANNSTLENKKHTRINLNQSIISQDGVLSEKNTEAQENKAQVRNIILKLLNIEGSGKHQEQELKKEVIGYQQYLDKYKSYLEFKEYNQYAEKDKQFEREKTPIINNRGEYLDKIDSRANLILKKYNQNSSFKSENSIDSQQQQQKQSQKSPLKANNSLLFQDKSIQQLLTIKEEPQKKAIELNIAQATPRVKKHQANLSFDIQQPKTTHVNNNKFSKYSLLPLKHQIQKSENSPVSRNDISQTDAGLNKTEIVPPIDKVQLKQFVNEFVSDKLNVLRVRRQIFRKRNGSPKIYHEEMYNSNYWQENPYHGFRQFQEQLQDLRQDYHNSKLELSCDVIRKAKKLKYHKVAIS